MLTDAGDYHPISSPGGFGSGGAKDTDRMTNNVDRDQTAPLIWVSIILLGISIPIFRFFTISLFIWNVLIF